MRDIIERPPEPGEALPPLWSRVAWFTGLSIVGALSCAVIAYALKMLLR